ASTAAVRLVILGACAAAVLLTACNPAPASQPAPPARIPRVGYLSAGRIELSVTKDAFLEGMHELGYKEGDNVELEYRFAGDYNLEAPALAADLLQQNVDVIVAVGSPFALAIKAATADVPIVMLAVADPVEVGLIDNLRRP